jgi:pyridinium-3,5-bisthiocarboxylic acid mononucleotide nickel chelatase
MAHGGDHEHEHEHSHGHEHEHHHDHPVTGRAPLAQGAGHGMVLYLDAPSGLAGDMIVAALVDLGVPQRVITDALAQLGVSGFHVHFGTRAHHSLVGTSFDVHVDGKHPHRSYSEIMQLLHALDAPVRIRAEAVFTKLGHAEARVHRCSLEAVHFHEVGAVDALCDIVGACAALAWLDATVLVSPLPMGRGFVKSAHGPIPLPAPATLECLTGFPLVDGGHAFEFVTPTGAALVSALGKPSPQFPAMRVMRTGFGAGVKSLEDRPNLLRAILGKPEAHAQDGSQVALLETNLDDASGELVAFCIERLLEAGALDAWAAPVVMKKGRPGLVLSVLANPVDADRMAEILLSESTSIGLRQTLLSRTMRPRKMVMVQTKYGELPVKVSEGRFGPALMKPEFEACKARALALNIPLREVLQEATSAARLFGLKGA